MPFARALTGWRPFSRVTNHNRSNNTSRMIVSIFPSLFIGDFPFFSLSLYLYLCLIIRNVVDREARLVPVLRTDEFSPPSSFCMCTHREHRAREASHRSISVAATTASSSTRCSHQSLLIHLTLITTELIWRERVYKTNLMSCECSLVGWAKRLSGSRAVPNDVSCRRCRR